MFFSLLGLLIGITTYSVTQCILSSFSEYNLEISANLSTYASVILGFLLMGFTVLFSYSDKSFFKGWKNSGHFNTWFFNYILALVFSVIVLLFSFIVLVDYTYLPLAFAFFSISIFFTILIFLPIFFSIHRI